MGSIIGIPNTRVSNIFINNRLTNQIHSDQIDLFRLEAQLSTGYKFQRPGEEPIAASATLSLQTELERKAQVRGNLNTTQSYYSASDSALSQISELMNSVRTMGLEAINTTTSDTQRTVLAQQVNQSTRQLMDAGNQRFRDRYLFTGSQTDVKPFEYGTDQNVIVYQGNELHMQSFVDLDLLYETNLTGTDVFNAISEPVKGTVDLNPAVTYDSLLSTLNGGDGVQRGSIKISNGSASSIVDLSGCVNVGDVVEKIVNNPPAGSVINASVTPTGLMIALDASTPGNLQITEVGNGVTAVELGILAENGIGMATLMGHDLNPELDGETKTQDILGARSILACRFPVDSANFIIEGTSNGSAQNGMSVQVINDVLITPGNETASYDPATDTVTVRISGNGMLADDMVTMLNDLFAAEPLDFEARVDMTGPGASPGSGRITVPLLQTYDYGVTQFGVDGILDSNGLQITNGKETYTIDFTGLETMDEVLNALNGSDAGVLAEFNKDKSGIDIRSRVSGADFMIGENGGETATELGVRTLVRETSLDDMNYGRGVMDYEGPGAKAMANFSSTAENSGLVFRALAEGTQWNDFNITFTDTSNADGSVDIAWDELNKTITVGITPGVTTANDVIEAFKTQAGPRDAFEINLDKSVDSTNDGTGVLYKGSTNTESGEDGGIDFTIETSDGSILDININGCDDIGEILDRINTRAVAEGMNLTASLAPYGNGIVLTDNTTGDGSLTIRRTQLSMAAIDLGLIPEGQMTHSETYAGTVSSATCDPAGVNNSLTFRTRYPGSYGNGTQIVYQEVGAPGDPPALAVTSSGGNYVFTFTVETGVTTGQEVMDLFNNTAPAAIQELFEVSGEADLSGTVSTPNTWAMADGNSPSLTAEDTNPSETESLFTAMIRMQEGLVENDILKIQRAVTVLDQAVELMNYSRADAGAKLQSLEALQFRLEDEDVELKTALSNEHDADLTQVITEMTTRQIALEAGFKSIATSYQMTLLNYI